jgi:hypothetical protein
MDFSRSKELLGDSLAAISMANEAAEISHMCLTILRWSLVLSMVLLEADFMVFKIDSANKESSADFL